MVSTIAPAPDGLCKSSQPALCNMIPRIFEAMDSRRCYLTASAWLAAKLCRAHDLIRNLQARSFLSIMFLGPAGWRREGRLRCIYLYTPSSSNTHPDNTLLVRVIHPCLPRTAMQHAFIKSSLRAAHHNTRGSFLALPPPKHEW